MPCVQCPVGFTGPSCTTRASHGTLMVQLDAHSLSPAPTPWDPAPVDWLTPLTRALALRMGVTENQVSVGHVRDRVVIDGKNAAQVIFTFNVGDGATDNQMASIYTAWERALSPLYQWRPIDGVGSVAAVGPIYDPNCTGMDVVCPTGKNNFPEKLSHAFYIIAVVFPSIAVLLVLAVAHRKLYDPRKQTVIELYVTETAELDETADEAKAAKRVATAKELEMEFGDMAGEVDMGEVATVPVGGYKMPDRAGASLGLFR